MKSLTQDDLIPYEEYERARDGFRQRIIQLKARRRIAVGNRITLVFENRETVQFQIQEMIRAERIVDPVKVQDELAIYNALLPADGELSATLFIEITDDRRIKQDLDALQGIDRGRVLAIKAGDLMAYGEFEGGHSKEDKISAVHFVTFCLDRDCRQALREPGPLVSILVDHPHYRMEVPVPEDLRQEWLADLDPTAGTQHGIFSRGTGLTPV